MDEDTEGDEGGGEVKIEVHDSTVPHRQRRSAELLEGDTGLAAVVATVEIDVDAARQGANLLFCNRERWLEQGRIMAVLSCSHQSDRHAGRLGGN
ncbi:hypothetical protein BM536_036845 [Streptomyces phaeoluteigriseus]|uniref:Uncharacterized protein n=1 Tax=Streptomyces phaeoluteigriseus TaxID=114686 RepID=A0A1V6MI35_9ACTN|nr:hypothetical protein BM536_036845 [Streptomyces phaeoluteigriseus]